MSEFKSYLIDTTGKNESFTQRVHRFAGQIGYKDVSPVWKWLAGARPKSATMQLIENLTKRRVPITSWFAAKEK